MLSDVSCLSNLEPFTDHSWFLLTSPSLSTVTTINCWGQIWFVRRRVAISSCLPLLLLSFNLADRGTPTTINMHRWIYSTFGRSNYKQFPLENNHRLPLALAVLASLSRNDCKHVRLNISLEPLMTHTPSWVSAMDWNTHVLIQCVQ